MSFETDIAMASRDGLSQFKSPASPAPRGPHGAAHDCKAPAVAEAQADVSLTLSARGRLLSGLVTGSDALQAPGAAPAELSRAKLVALETRLVAARQDAPAMAAADAQRPANATTHDVHVGRHLAQAAQATAFLQGRADNPFGGLTRPQCTAVAHDESGHHTINERHAAARGRDELDRRFWTPVMQRALASGDWRPMIEAGLVFHSRLSPLEQAIYPVNYKALMQQYLALPEASPCASAQPQQQRQLFDLLASLVLPTGPLAQHGELLSRLLEGLNMPAQEVSAESPMPQSAAAGTLERPLAQAGATVRMNEEQSYAVLLQRLFGVQQPDAEPSPLRRLPANAAGIALPQLQALRSLLNFADRRYLAEAYAYADAMEIDAAQVDALADDLAMYRHVRGGGVHGGAGPRAYQMSLADASVARRMLSSEAARDTRLDHGFLAWLLDPCGGGWSEGERSGHAVGFSVLEKLLSGLAGMHLPHTSLAEQQLEPDYRYALYRLNLHDQHELHDLHDLYNLLTPAAADEAAAARTMTPAQMLALGRGQAAERDFIDSALALLRMYRVSLRMTDTEQRTMSELVYATLRRHRLRRRRGKLFVAWSTRSPLMPALPEPKVAGY